MSEREQAIADMEFARTIHREWAEYLEGGPPPAEIGPDPENPQGTVGGARWHREWTVKYERVIRLLREGTPDPRRAHVADPRRGGPL